MHGGTRYFNVPNTGRGLYELVPDKKTTDRGEMSAGAKKRDKKKEEVEKNAAEGLGRGLGVLETVKYILIHKLLC